MPRTLALFTGPWADQPLETVAAKANDWGYQALDLACWGEHLTVQKALAEPAYCRSILQTLEQHELSLIAISNHRVGQAVSDRIDARHQAVLPEWVWGNGGPEGVASRATQEMIDTAKVAQQLGVNLVHGVTGSPFTAMHFNVPPVTASILDACWQEFSNRWVPILDAYAQVGCRFACEIGPGQTAYDQITTEATLLALSGHPAWGMAFNPTSLHWLGADSSEFIRRYGERIWHVLVQDAAITLNSKSSLLGSLLPLGHPQRGWNPRMLGQGTIDWPSILRALHQVHYDGPLTVSYLDADIDRDYGAADSVHLLRRLDFEPVHREEGLFG